MAASDHINSSQRDAGIRYQVFEKNLNIRAYDRKTRQRVGSLELFNPLMKLERLGATHQVHYVGVEDEYQGRGIATGMYGAWHDHNPDSVVGHDDWSMNSKSRPLTKKLQERFPGKHVVYKDEN
jgi:hypothetical protein